MSTFSDGGGDSDTNLLVHIGLQPSIIRELRALDLEITTMCVSFVSFARFRPEVFTRATEINPMLTSQGMQFSVNLSPEESDKVDQLGGAAWIEYLVRQDILPGLYVEILPAGYGIDYDDALAAHHLPMVAKYEALDPCELEAVYYRIMKRPPAESCIEYIYYWNFQYFPPHSYDYEPIYVYLHDGEVDQVAFDFYDYDARVFSHEPPFEICGLWHAFDPLDHAPIERLDRPLARLDNAVLSKWYNRPYPKSKFVIRRKLTDPWLLRDKSTFRDDDTDTRFHFARPAIENIDEYYQTMPAPKKTFSVSDALRIDTSEMKQQIMNQFLAAGYVEVREGHAVWTSEGERIRKALEKNLN